MKSTKGGQKKVKKSGLKYSPVQKTGKIIDKQKAVKKPASKTHGKKAKLQDKKYSKAMKVAFPY